MGLFVLARSPTGELSFSRHRFPLPSCYYQYSILDFSGEIATLRNMKINFAESLVGRPNTVKTQKSLFSKWIEPMVDGQAACELHSHKFITGLVKFWLEDNDLSPRTVRSLLSLYKKYVQWETASMLIVPPHINRILANATQPDVPKVWSRKECKAALDTAQEADPELYKMMLVTLHTGVRLGELFGLKWGDFDLINDRVTISRSYDGPTKNGKSRVIPLSNGLDNLVQKDYIVGKEDEHLFRRFPPNVRLEAVSRQAGVPVLTWHGLRHTFATLALEAGCSPKLVSTALGHSKLSTTLDIYWNVTKEKIDMRFVP